MARAENEALVRRIFAAFAEKRGFALRDAFADDATWTVPGSGTMAGTFRGREEIFAFLGRLPKETGRHLRVVADRRSRVRRSSGRALPGERRTQRATPRARSGAAVPDRGRARPRGARTAERPGRLRGILGLMTTHRLQPLRRDHVRLLRHADRLGARDPECAPTGACAPRDRPHRGRAARALCAARGGARGGRVQAVSSGARRVAERARQGARLRRRRRGVARVRRGSRRLAGVPRHRARAPPSARRGSGSA